VRDSIQQQGGEIDQEALAQLLKLLRYVGGDYQEPATFDLLKKALGSASRPAHYLATGTRPTLRFGAVPSRGSLLRLHLLAAGNGLRDYVCRLVSAEKK
jgi:glucose-6-phosphate 1-dehydrogenase